MLLFAHDLLTEKETKPKLLHHYQHAKKSAQFMNTSLGCVNYIFDSFYCMSKRQHFTKKL